MCNCKYRAPALIFLTLDCSSWCQISGPTEMIEWLYIVLRRSRSKILPSWIWRWRHCRWRAAKFTPLLGAYGFSSRAGSLSCHTCYDTGLWVLWSHYPKDQVHVELPFTTSWYRGLFLTRIPTGSEIHMKTPDKYSQVILIWLHGFQIMGDSTWFITVSMIETHRFTIHLLKKINYRKFSHGSKAYLQI